MSATSNPVSDRQGLRTVPEVAQFLAVSRSKVYQMMDAGTLPHVKLGHSRRIRWTDVEQLVSESTVRGSSSES